MLIFWTDILGTVVFAVSGVLLAARLKMDLFGAIVLGVVTAVGGGTFRDMMLAQGAVFWVIDPTDLIVAVVSCVISIIGLRIFSYKQNWLLPVLDAIGLAAFVGIGVDKAFAAQAGAFVAVCMGMLTGVGGGIIRDVLARQIPIIFQTEIYATACLVGASVHVVCLYWFGLQTYQALMFGFIATLGIRLAAIYWNLKLPIVSNES